MQGPGNQAAPGEDDKGDKAEEGANADKDGAFWECRFLHEGRVSGWGDGRRRIVVFSQFGEGGYEAILVGSTDAAGKGGEV